LFNRRSISPVILKFQILNLGFRYNVGWPQNRSCILLRRLLSGNRRNNSLFLYSSTLFLLLHFLLFFLIFTFVCAASSQFSPTHIAIFSLTYSLLHYISLSCSCSHWYVVFFLACCSLSFFFALIVFCDFIHSIFAFSGCGRFRLGRFAFPGFALTVYKRYVFLSLYA